MIEECPTPKTLAGCPSWSLTSSTGLRDQPDSRRLLPCSSSHLSKRCSVTQLCPTLWDPMGCSPPGSSVHGILQARILEWVPALTPDFPDPGIEPASLLSPALTGGFFTTSATWEAPYSSCSLLSWSRLPPPSCPHSCHHALVLLTSFQSYELILQGAQLPCALLTPLSPLKNHSIPLLDSILLPQCRECTSLTGHVILCFNNACASLS